MSTHSVRTPSSKLNLSIFSTPAHKLTELIGFDALHLESTMKIDSLTLESVHSLSSQPHSIIPLNARFLLLIFSYRTQIPVNMQIFEFVVPKIYLWVPKTQLFFGAILLKVFHFLEATENFVLRSFILYLQVHWPFYTLLLKWHFILQVKSNLLWEVLLFCWNANQVKKRRLLFFEDSFPLELVLLIFMIFKTLECNYFFLS